MGKRLRTGWFLKALILTAWPSFILLPGPGLYAQSPVRIWEEPLVIPTYLVQAPEPNPIFYNGRAYQGAQGPVYPYPFLDRLTDVRKELTYQAVYLENQYVRICVLPEIGGRIFEGLDKTNNYDFIYRQHVIKPALIGMLGAWISGGVEWNIPHHHRATTFLPVDHAIVKNPDGSATVWAGELELRHRTRWLVGLTLKPNSAAIDVTIKILNRTPLPHSMLCFANVAVHATKEYQVIFPPDTEFATFHGKNQFSRWPISSEVYNRQDYTKGVDVSWWKNHSAPTSFFAWDNKGDFLAGYDHGKEAGVAFVGDHHFVPGKKLWTWGTGPEGKLWEKILTETDGPYAELMFGAYSDNQPDYSWTQPYEVRTVRQTWFPIRKIGGLKAANRDAACNLTMTSKETAVIGFYTPAEFRDATVVAKSGEKTILEEKITIGPDRPFFKEVPVATGTEEESLALVLFTSDGKEIITYKPLKKKSTPMPTPVTPPSAPKDIPTIEELYLTGLRLEQFYNPAFEPYPYYEEALKRDPDDYRVNTALGILYLKRAMYEEAAEKLQRAVRRAAKNYTRPKDGEAFYYLGVSLRALGRLKEAEDAFFRATWSAAWAGAAFYQLAEMACGRCDLGMSLELVDSSLAANGANTKALDLKAALLRRSKKLGEAEKIASEVLASDPLDFWAGYELYLALTGSGRKEEADKVIESLAGRMRVDTPVNYLELALDYGNCGLRDEAIEILTRLTESKGRGAALFPLLHYFLAYYWDQKGDGQKARSVVLRAASMPPDYCFPFQSECLDVLSWSQRINPKDARAPYYLGNYLFDLQPEKALVEWEKSVALDSSFSISQRNLGLAYARVKNDIPKAIACLEKAVACNANDPRLCLELDQLYEAGQFDPQKRLALLEKNHKVVSLRDDVLTREIILLVQTGRYDRAIDLLKSHHFHVWEGGGEIHGIFVEAHLLRGQDFMAAQKYRQALADFETALTYPENLEVAAPASAGGSAKIFYWIGMAFAGLGDDRGATANLEKAAGVRSVPSEQQYFQALAFKKLGRDAEASKALDGLIRYAGERLKSAPSMDFFEKFGERQSAMIRNAQMHYLLGLGYLGKGLREQARAEFEMSVSLNINNIGARQQLAALKKQSMPDRQDLNSCDHQE